MIYYNDLPISEEIKEALAELTIEYVFQSIFLPDGKTIYAREALMRPQGTTVTELIEEYTKRDRLHILEVATFFGATQAYMLRGYDEKIAINSFPCECFNKQEIEAYVDYFGRDKEIVIIELLEYPFFSMEKTMKKKNYAQISNSQIALDDFGSGFNDHKKVALLEPDIIKIDRSLLSGIDHCPEKQVNCKEIIDTMHDKGMLVVAEGIETKEEFDYLVSLGADLFQGYYLQKPA